MTEEPTSKTILKTAKERIEYSLDVQGNGIDRETLILYALLSLHEELVLMNNQLVEMRTAEK